MVDRVNKNSKIERVNQKLKERRVNYKSKVESRGNQNPEAKGKGSKR